MSLLAPAPRHSLGGAGAAGPADGRLRRTGRTLRVSNHRAGRDDDRVGGPCTLAQDLKPGETSGRPLRVMASLGAGRPGLDFEPSLMPLALTLLVRRRHPAGRNGNLLPQLTQLGAGIEERAVVAVVDRAKDCRPDLPAGATFSPGR